MISISFGVYLPLPRAIFQHLLYSFQLYNNGLNRTCKTKNIKKIEFFITKLLTYELNRIIIST
nr:MAG TPA: hypothetical protein [Caudoviricetes sp.]